MHNIYFSTYKGVSTRVQDFKTGWLTFASPMAMFIAQMAGMCIGCFIAPLTFWLYWKGFVLGDPNGRYPAPFATLYRNMAVVAVDGTGSLPDHCLDISALALLLADLGWHS